MGIICLHNMEGDAGEYRKIIEGILFSRLFRWLHMDEVYSQLLPEVSIDVGEGFYRVRMTTDDGKVRASYIVEQDALPYPS